MPDPLPLKLAKAILLPSADQDTPESGFGTTPCRDPGRSTVGLRDPVPIVFTARPADSNPLIVVKARRGPSGAGAAAAAGPPTSASASATAQRPPAYRNTRGILHYWGSRGSNAWSLTSVSASSAAGSEPATTPTPAKRRGSRSRSRALRRATQNSPSSVASTQPTGPAYQPRSIRSSSAIAPAALPGQGSPPTAGVGCSRPASSTAECDSASWAITGVARCWMLATLITSGSGALCTQTACGRSARTIRSATIRCSRRSLSLRSSCSPRWSSTAGSELRRVEPARATVEAPAPERRVSSSGLAPRSAAAGDPRCGAVDGRFEVARETNAANLRPLGEVRIEQRQRLVAQAGQPGGDSNLDGVGIATGADDRVHRQEGTIALTTDRQLGQTHRRRAERGPVRGAGAVRSEGEATGPDRSSTRRQPDRLVEDRPLAQPRALARHVGEPVLAARARLVRHPQGRKREPAVGLLPAEPVVGGQARGEDGRARVHPTHRHGDAYEGFPAPGESALDRRSEAGEEVLSLLREQSRSRPSGPSRSGRGGGSSARRPRSCRPSRSPRSSSRAARRRRSWRGRSRRTG